MIREGTHEDVPRLMPLVEEFHVAAKLDRFASFDGSAWGPWLEKCAEEPKLLLLVIEDGGEFAGFLTAIEADAYWNPAIKFVTEAAMWVDKGSRGKGLGKGLIKAMMGWAKDRGAGFVASGAAQRLNPKAVGNLLAGCGFTLEEKIYTRRIS
jgi:GNAT superfamily N-acetyltransferase